MTIDEIIDDDHYFIAVESGPLPFLPYTTGRVIKKTWHKNRHFRRLKPGSTLPFGYVLVKCDEETYIGLKPGATSKPLANHYAAVTRVVARSNPGPTAVKVEDDDPGFEFPDVEFFDDSIEAVLALLEPAAAVISPDEMQPGEDPGNNLIRIAHSAGPLLESGAQLATSSQLGEVSLPV